MYYASVGVSLRQTPVGRGVFSQRKIRKGATVGRMKGTVISHDDYDPHYVVDLGRHGVLDPGPPFRFLNHSCEPNAQLVEVDDEDGPQIYVEALRTIRPGDQITIDYAWSAEPDALRCGCGAAGCRGWVVDARQVARLKRMLKVR